MSFLRGRVVRVGGAAVARHAGRYAHVGQRGAEVLVDVGLQHRVKVLELDVPDQRDDKNLRAVTGVKRNRKATPPHFLRARSPAR